MMQEYEPNMPRVEYEILFSLMAPGDGENIPQSNFTAWLAAMFMDQEEPCQDLDAELGRLMKAVPT